VSYKKHCYTTASPYNQAKIEISFFKSAWVAEVKETYSFKTRKMSSDELTCSACLQPETDWKGSAKGPCGHSMCMPCFMTWVRLGKPSCPLCRNDFVAAAAAAALVADEGAFLPDMVYQQEQEQVMVYGPFEHRQALRQASRARRLTFLYDKQDEFRAHCLVCTDAVCRKTHARRMRWLERG
jgi:hypothetical protein